MQIFLKFFNLNYNLKVFKIFMRRTFLAYNAPTQHDLDCRQRLLECNKVVRQVNKSLVPRMIFPWILNLMSCYIRPIAEFGLYNRTFISTVSNLPIPSSEQLLVNQKHSICSIDYAIGLGDGIQGIDTFTKFIFCQK